MFFERGIEMSDENKIRNLSLLGKNISGFFAIPSGIVVTEVPTLKIVMEEIPEVGILTTKSIGVEPRAGNREPIIAQYGELSFINAVGLANPGAEEFARRLSRIKIPDNKFLLVSIFGNSEKEFKTVAEKLYSYADGFELNISCPHSDKYGQVVGQDGNLVERIARAVSSLGKPVFVKVSPNLNIEKTVTHALKGEISGITAINTKGPEGCFYKGYSVLSNKVGGISGKAILELGIECVREIREITDLPIIACGGISNARDVERYRQAGANFFGVGSALAGMNTEEMKRYFRELLSDLEKRTSKAWFFLKNKPKMEYIEYKVAENEKLDEEMFTIKLDRRIIAEPGQFIFVWLPSVGEKPFSVFDDKPLTLFVKKRGVFTEELAKLKTGETVYARGPYGNSPKIGRKVLLVGGGTGIAALYLFAKENQKAVALFGVKNDGQLPRLKYPQRTYFTTENGEVGHKGLVTDILGEVVDTERPDFCINCGPEAMIKTAVQIESQYVNLTNIYSSIDFLTRCGIGLCGSCSTSKGYRSCVDGSFFKPDQL